MIPPGKIHSHIQQDRSHTLSHYKRRCTQIDLDLKPVKLLLLAVWFGLLTGLAEVSIRGVQKFLLDERIYVSPHIVWMAPLADTILFLVLGFFLFLAARRWPRFVSLRLATVILAFLGCFGPLFMYPRVHHYAALVLAAGLAVQTGHFITAHTHGFWAFARRTAGLMVALILALTIGVSAWQELKERSMLSKLPPASPGAPNVLLIVLDTVRSKSLSLYGYARPTTPFLESFAKHSVVFERVLSTSPWTLPAHATMFTGRFPHEVSADWLTPLDATFPTLPGAFTTRGYLTAGFVANLLYCTYETRLNRGFVHYEDYPISLGMIIRSSWLARIIIAQWIHGKILGNRQDLVRISAAEINGRFLHWLSQKNGRPFFAFLNYFDAHAPYLPPAPFDFLSGPMRVRPDPSLQPKWSPQEIQIELSAYEGSIAYIDHQLGLLFNELQKRSLLENTLIIITSDHGEQFGEHGLFSHGNSLYRSLLQVPLLISFSGRVPKGIRVNRPVSLQDLPATVMDLIEFESDIHFPGNSLARHWEGTHNHSSLTTPLLASVSKGINTKPHEPASIGDMLAILFDGMYYIKNGDGSEEIYDFENDPEERRNLATLEKGRRALVQLNISLRMVLGNKR